MNILYFTRTMGVGGTEKVILQLCSAMNGKFDKIVVCSCGGVNTKQLDELGIRHYEIDDIESKNLKVIYNTFKSLLNIIKEENIQIIHTHHRMAAFYAKIIKLFNNKLRFIHTAHNTFNDKKKLTSFILNDCEVIAVGDMVKKNLTEVYGINEKNIDVIHNSIQIEEEDIIYDENISELKAKGYFVVGNIGRISKQKGMEYFVKSIADVVKINPKIVGIIIGEGEEKHNIDKLINELNINNNIKFLGYRNDVLNIIKQLDLVVLSSLWEGYPLLPIETFSVGKTIIATSVDGTKEIVKNNYNGILVPPKNSEKITKNILKLCEDKELLRILEINAKNTYDKELKFNIFVEKYEKIYDRSV